MLKILLIFSSYQQLLLCVQSFVITLEHFKQHHWLYGVYSVLYDYSTHYIACTVEGWKWSLWEFCPVISGVSYVFWNILGFTSHLAHPNTISSSLSSSMMPDLVIDSSIIAFLQPDLLLFSSTVIFLISDLPQSSVMSHRLLFSFSCCICMPKFGTSF